MRQDYISNNPCNELYNEAYQAFDDYCAPILANCASHAEYMDADVPELDDFLEDWFWDYAVTQAEIYAAENPDADDDFTAEMVGDYAGYLHRYHDNIEPATFAQYRQWVWERRYSPRLINYAA